MRHMATAGAVRWAAAATLALCLGVAPYGSARAEEPMKTVAITAREFSFTPAAITLRRGQRVALRITDRGTMNHEFVSPTLFGAAEDVEVRVAGAKVEAGEVEEVEYVKGQTVTIELTPTRAGTYRFWCAETFQGKLHRDLGMRGTITVRP